jgi:hypothetical protein
MFERIHQKLGTAGFIISIVALVAALSGGAYAASGGLTGKQKKEVAKIAKKEAQKLATAGAQGPAGPAGVAGPAGGKGDPGTAGTNGADGAPGEKGSKGDPGEPSETGFATELPPGETESGTWGFGSLTKEQEEGNYALYQPISFPTPLPQGEGSAAGGEANEVAIEFRETEAAPTANCPGSASEPRAAEGVLCVYESFGFGWTFTASVEPESGENEAGAGRRGALLYFTNLKEFGFGGGTWAVTARE